MLVWAMDFATTSSKQYQKLPHSWLKDIPLASTGYWFKLGTKNKVPGTTQKPALGSNKYSLKNNE